MAFFRVPQLADLTPVAANGTATMQLPAAGVYHVIELRGLDNGVLVPAANMAEDIAEIRLTIDGSQVMEMSGEQAYRIAEYHYGSRGYGRRPGILPIFLSPFFMPNAAQAIPLGYGMRDVGVFQMEVKFGSAVTTTGHIDQVQVFVYRDPVSRPLGTHRRILQLERNFGSTGKQQITDIPIERGDARVGTTAMHIFYDGGTTTINEVDVVVNNEVVMNLTPDVIRTLYEMAGFEYQIAGIDPDMFTIPFDLWRDLSGFLDHADIRDLRLDVTWGTAAPGNYTILREAIFGMRENNA